ncbi:MAG TPA: methyltransferase domain-containing protein [Polyangiaceae bacterium]
MPNVVRFDAQMDPALVELCQCPRCGERIEAPPGDVRCAGCGIHFPVVGSIPCLFAEPERKIAQWRGEVHHYRDLVERSVRSIEEQLEQFAMLATTRRRLERLLAANRQNGETVLSMLRAANLTPEPGDDQNRDFTMIEYYDHILRDWAPDASSSDENAGARELVLEVLGDDRRLGRMVVLGAGACRLAHDLHQTCRPELTLALDMNPLLLLAAQRIVIGEGLRLFEFPAVPASLDSVCVERQLSAAGSLLDHFHLVLADAFAMPLRAGAFDTVVTPWFIDIVPVDLRDTLGVIHRLLAPGGRWINYGPLHYRQDHPVAQRYTADEVFTLSALAGFDVSEKRIGRIDLLTSQASARSRTEQVVASAACKADPPPLRFDGQVPAWLLLAHLPIPRFAGLDGYRPEHGVLAYVARKIDGKATLGDIAACMIQEHGARKDAALHGTRALVTIVYQACYERSR